MNERIRQLAEQVYGSHATEQEIKFAELIVRECIDIVDNQGAFMRFNHLAGKIKQHFGVEK
jgi:hypothetical protein